MIHHGHTFRLAIGTLSAGCVLTVCAQTLTPVPKEQADPISALIGTRLTVQPSHTRHVLVFWRCEGFVHGQALAYGNKALELAAAQTHAFTVDFSNDYAALRPDNLAKYDAVVLNNTTMLNTTDNPFIEPALVAFVRSGKGLAVIHSGADNFYKAERAAEMVGGRFWGHPWGGGGTWAFKLDDPASSLNRAFNGQNFKAGDEIYQQQSPFYNRAKLHVLISLDLSDKANYEAQGQRRDDKDFAVSWIRPYGKGRVFYTSFGHDQRTFLDKARLTHILDGIQYALGDLKADDTPAGLSAADLAAVRTATADTANAAFALLQDVIAHTGHAATEAANKAKIETLLGDPATTPFGKKAILRALLACGGTKEIATVTACLELPDACDWAVTLLAGTPGQAAGDALVQALARAEPALRCNLLYALGIRKNTDAIIPFLTDHDPAVATAAYGALGRIGSTDALAALQKPAPAPALEDARLSALTACIGTLADAGKPRAAARAAKPLFDNAAQAPALRAAAARALLLADDDFFAQGMKDACPAVRQTVIRAADRVPVKTLAAALASAAPSDQAALAAKLAARDAKRQAPAVAALLASDHPFVVVEALHALTRIGSVDQIPAIYALTSRDGDVGVAAKAALGDLRAPGTGDALLALARKDPAQQTAVLAILGERNEFALIPKLEPFLKSPSADVRREAWKTLGKTADDRAFAQLVAWLALIRDEESDPAESAVRAAGKNADDAARVAALLQAWKSAPSAATKKTLAGLMSGYADDAFVAPLAAATGDADRELRETVLRALADWRSMAPFAVLRDAVGAQTDAGLKTVALRGAIKLVSANAGGDTRARLIELFKLAPDDRGRTTVVDALFRSEGLEAFGVLQGLFGDTAYGASAKKAYVALFDGKIKGQAGVPAGDISPKKWKAHASHNDREAGRAVDRDPGTRWSSNKASEPGMWFTLDLGESVFISEIVLDTEKSGGDTPNGYEVYVSGDGKNWSGPVAKSDGNTHGKTVISLAAQAHDLKFVTTGGRPGLHWSIHEIYAKAGLDQKKVAEIQKVADGIR